MEFGIGKQYIVLYNLILNIDLHKLDFEKKSKFIFKDFWMNMSIIPPNQE